MLGTHSWAKIKGGGGERNRDRDRCTGRVLSALCRKLLSSIRKETWAQSPKRQKGSNMLISDSLWSRPALCLYFLAFYKSSENMPCMASHR